MFVLQPMRTGRWRGRSYAIYPHCTALPNAGLSWYLGRRLWRHTLRRWLLASITATAREATPEERETLFSIGWNATSAVIVVTLQANLRA